MNKKEFDTGVKKVVEEMSHKRHVEYLANQADTFFKTGSFLQWFSRGWMKLGQWIFIFFAFTFSVALLSIVSKNEAVFISFMRLFGFWVGFGLAIFLIGAVWRWLGKRNWIKIRRLEHERKNNSK